MQEAAKRAISLKTSALAGAERLEEGLAAGDEVEHPIFGAGVVLSVDVEAQKVVVQFDRLNTQRTLSARARMKKTGHREFSEIMH